MDKFLKAAMKKKSLKVNKVVRDGYVSDLLDDIPDYLDKFIKSSVEKLPIEYMGYRLLTPKEEIMMEKSGKGRIKTDISVSSIRRIRFTFMIDETEVIKDIFILVSNDDGTVSISGTKYYLAPVWTDNIVSPHKDHIFIKPNKIKLQVFSNGYLIKENGVIKKCYIPYIKKFYKQQITVGKYKGVETPIAIYMLGAYTLNELRARYNIGTFVITEDDVELNDKYIVYSSMNKQPLGVKLITDYNHKYKVVIDKDANLFTKILAQSVIYAFDFFHQSIKSNFELYSNSVTFWRILLAKLIFKASYDGSSALNNINMHLKIIDNYVDSITIEEFKNDLNVDIENFWDIIFYILNNYEHLSKLGLSNINNILDKKLDLTYYLMYKTLTSFNKCFNELKGLMNKGQLNPDTLKKSLNNHIKIKNILTISKSKTAILPLQLANTINSSKLKMSINVELQERGKGVEKQASKSQKKLPDNYSKLRGADLYAGNFLYLYKQAPTPLLRLNPFAVIENNKLKPNKLEMAVIEKTDKVLLNKTANVDLNKLEEDTEK